MLKCSTKAVAFFVVLYLSTTICLAASDSDEHHDAHAESPHGHDAAHADSSGHVAVNPNPLTVDPDLAIVTAVIFLLLLLVLAKFAWRPIMEALDRREQGIVDQLDEAKRINAQAKKISADYERKLAAAADEVRELLEEARRDAEATKQRIVAEAQDAAATERDRAVREIELAKYDALHELSQQSVQQAIDLAGQVVGREVNAEDHAGLIKESLEKFPSQPSFN